MKKHLLVLVSVLIGIGFGLEFARQAYFYPHIPNPDYPSPQSRTAAWRQDLDRVKTYIHFNRPYTDEARDTALTIVNELETNIDDLTDAEVKLGIAEAVALSQNGHSFVRLSDFTLSEGRVPIMGRMFDDGYYVLWATPPYEFLLGAQIVSIDGHPIEDVIKAFRQYSGARDTYFRLYVPWLLETPSLVHAIGYAESPTHYVLGVIPHGSESVSEVEIVVDTSVTIPTVNPNDVLTPLDLPGWQGLPASLPATPTFLSNWDEVFYVQAIDSINGLYIRYGANNDVGDYRISTFNSQIKDTLRQHDYSVVIIDQRDNNGGDYTLTYAMMNRLPDLVGEDTRIFIITGPQTFSAGLSSVAFLKNSGGEQVTIVGSEMGDFERHWGETSLLTLPNSQLTLQLATGLHDYADGCYQFPQCYWLDFFFNVAVDELSPEIAIPFTFEHYINGEDAAINYILH